jgi:hypothetical protein
MKKQEIRLSSEGIDEELEFITLANLVSQPKFIDKTIKILSNLGSKVFSGGAKSLIYETLLKMRAEKEPIDSQTVKIRLRKEKVPNSVCDVLFDLTTSSELILWASMEKYLKELKDLAVKRGHRQEAEKYSLALNDGKDPIEAKQELDKGIADIESYTEKVKRGMTLLESLATPIKEPSSPIGAGFLAPERYTTIAAQDGEGKTTFCLQLSLCACSGVTFLGRFPIKNPCKVLYFCGENSRGDINTKATMQISELEKLVKGGDVSKYLENLILVRPLEIDFTLDRAEDRGKLAWWLKTYEPNIVIFDPVADFVGTEKSLSDDILARKTIKTLNVIARDFGVFPILVLHFKKESEELKEIFEKPHGSKFFVNSAAAQICMERADKVKYESAKRIHCKFKLITDAPNLYVLRDRETLWYSEIDKGEMSKAKLLPKHIVNFIVEECKGRAVPTILYEMAADKLNCSQIQIRELVKLAIDQGLIEKKRGILIPITVKIRGKVV